MSKSSIPRNTPGKQPEPHTNPDTIEPVYSWLTDRELLALMVRTLEGCDFLSDIQECVERERDHTKNLWDDDDYLILLGEYYSLEGAVKQAAHRIAADNRGGVQ